MPSKTIKHTKMTHLNYLLLLALFILLSSSSCEKRLSCSRNWTFEVPVNLTNIKNSYLVGDTLLFESKFGEEYTDLKTGDKVIIPVFPFDIRFALSQIDENPWQWANQDFKLIQFENQFDFIGISTGGRPGQGGSFRSMFIKEGTQNSLMFGLVCKKPGVFTIEFLANAGLDRERERADFSDNCADYILPFQFRMNDHSENGFNLYNGSIDTTLHSVSREVYEKIGAYSFVVE